MNANNYYNNWSFIMNTKFNKNYSKDINQFISVSP